MDEQYPADGQFHFFGALFIDGLFKPGKRSTATADAAISGLGVFLATANFFWLAAGILTFVFVLDAVLIAIAMARFRRDRLILD